MIHLTPDAIKEFKRLGKHRKQDLSQSRLRIEIQSGSCSDFSYSLTFDSALNGPDDVSIDGEALAIVISRQDVEALDGLTIDYSEDLMGGAFRFVNPNATYTCDCGNSFSLTPVESSPATDD